MLSAIGEVFIQAPGDFMFFVLVLVTSVFSLLQSFGYKQIRSRDESERITVALGGITFLWVLYCVATFFISYVNQEPNSILPPMEWAIGVANVLLLSWAFSVPAFPQWYRVSNFVLLGLLLIVVGQYAVSGTMWIGIAADQDFNRSAIGSMWIFTYLGVSLVALLLSLYVAPDTFDAPLKFLLFLILFSGAAAMLALQLSGDLIGNYPGILRFAKAFAYLLLPLIMYREARSRVERLLQTLVTVPQGAQNINRAALSPDRVVATEHMVATESLSPLRKTTTTEEQQSMQLLRSLGLILEDVQPEQIPTRIVNVALNNLGAEVGALLQLHDANYADVSYAYDQVAGRKIPAISLNLDDQPTLVNAIERQQMRALYPDRNEEELRDLYTRFDIDTIGPTYFQPLRHGDDVLAVLMLGIPYRREDLERTNIELLRGFGILASALFTLGQAAVEAVHRAEDRMIQEMVEGAASAQRSATDASRANLQVELAASREQNRSLTKQLFDLKLQLDDERSRVASLLGDSAEMMSVSQRIEALATQQDELRAERDRLLQRLQEIESVMQGVRATDNQSMMQAQARTLHEERERLQRERDALARELDDLRARDKEVADQDVQELLNYMMDERNRLEDERNQLVERVQLMEKQLQTMGISDDRSGLSELIQQLYEERANLVELNGTLQQERDTLLQERSRMQDWVRQEEQRDLQLEQLSQAVKNLAADREAAMKQRDQLRQERTALVEKLNLVKANRAQMMARALEYESRLEEAQEVEAALRVQIEQLQIEASRLRSERERQGAALLSAESERDQLLSQTNGIRPVEVATASEDTIGNLRQMVDELSHDREALETEVARLRQELVQMTSEGHHEPILPVDDAHYQLQHPELLVGLVQELRTPMTSIAGYIDLLLGESAGILGEMQRKFLHRVSANVARLDTMIDGLVDVTELDTGQYELEPSPIDVVGLVENALTNAAMQFREKELTVELDIDDDIPLLAADRDALNQIFGQLLSNAYLVTPPDGKLEVMVARRNVRLRDEGPARDCLYVAVTDHGGGIAREDIPRVFARKYKADNPLVDGIGDTGVGLSIAKALVEVHDGRLWVQSRPGSTTTFQFAIPYTFETLSESKLAEQESG